MPTHAASQRSALGLLSGPPIPDSATAIRWTEGQRRRRLLEGLWKIDLKDALRKEFEPRRRRLLGMPDTTKNLFRSLISQLAVLYDRPPVVMHEDADAVDTMNEITREAGLWQLAIMLQQQTLGLREGFYRFDVPPDTGRLLVRIVPADLLWADAWAHDPDNPHTVYEYRLRPKNDGDLDWTRDVMSIKDPDNPVFRVESGDGKTDLSDIFLPEDLSGSNYPYRRQEGTPIIPGVLYHAARTGNLFDPFRGIELVDGTLTVAGLLTQWRHLVRDASWPQRWAINAVVDGLEPNAQGDMSITTDPTTLINFRPKVPGQSSAVGQFAPGGDPLTLGNAIRDYATDLAADFEVTPADVQRVHASRSGYAIEITRAGQRSAQRRLEPQFNRGDVQSLEVIAALWNRAHDTDLPEDGWSIEYLGLPLSMEERRLLMEDHTMRAALGVTSKPRLLAALEGITVDQARAQLVEIQIDNATFDTTAANTADNRPTDEDGATNQEANPT